MLLGQSMAVPITGGEGGLDTYGEERIAQFQFKVSISNRNEFTSSSSRGVETGSGRSPFSSSSTVSTFHLNGLSS